MIGVALSTRDLVKRYGRRLALDGFTLSVPQGAVMGLVGPNGAGKTTWMMSVAGFLRPTSGTIDLLGKGPFDASIHSGRISILPQDSELPLEATPAALLYRYGRLQGLSAATARASADAVLAEMNLADRVDSPIRALSHGMRKRVMLAQCFLGSPEVLLLDEPLNGLDPVEQDRMRRFILARRGRQTIIVSSHNLNDVEILCSHVAFVEKGKVARMASVRALTEEAGRLSYLLANVPSETRNLEAALAKALPGAKFTWQTAGEERRTLVCTYEAAVGTVATVNRTVLPVLLAHTDVLSVETGLSLEQAYLTNQTQKTS
ncbi:MAG: ABC transporter ATP-binding protein [Kiritimatiellae bacterium]|nr:ABC transporter ATP-binding protein [Kiritimatiellia bacterium]